MRGRVRLRVRVAPEMRPYEFLVSTCLCVKQVLPLMTHLVRTSTAHAYGVRDAATLLLCEGDGAGLALDAKTCFEELLEHGVVTDGSTLLLV